MKGSKEHLSKLRHLVYCRLGSITSEKCIPIHHPESVYNRLPLLLAGFPVKRKHPRIICWKRIGGQTASYHSSSHVLKDIRFLSSSAVRPYQGKWRPKDDRQCRVSQDELRDEGRQRFWLEDWRNKLRQNAEVSKSSFK